MFVAKVRLLSGRVSTVKQRAGESFNSFMDRVEFIFKDREVTIQVREIVGGGVGE
jgi:hypothetical protein